VCREYAVDPLDAAAAFLRAGVRLVQLRMKGGADAEFLDLADALVAEARRHGARVVINDRADIARMAHADGVHVGQHDLPIEGVRRIVGAAAIVGISTHDERQLEAALASSADYVAVGPVYATATKATGYAPRGLSLVRAAANRGKPIVAIGGITLARASEVLDAGAAWLAVITDLVAAGDPELRARDYLRLSTARPKGAPVTGLVTENSRPPRSK
jgi:thiamine-phosphate pyrophosphorylase